jgi:hypothetical protein
MSKARAKINYVKLAARVSPIEDSIKIVARIRPRIRAVFNHVNIVAIIEEASFIATETIWDDGNTQWDVVDGVANTHWDIGLP